MRFVQFMYKTPFSIPVLKNGAPFVFVVQEIHVQNTVGAAESLGVKAAYEASFALCCCCLCTTPV